MSSAGAGVPVTLKVFPSTVEDQQQGWVWLQSDLPPRSIVKLKNLDTSKSVYCEALQIDLNFLRRYNQKPRRTIDSPTESIVMSGWYRLKLGDIQTQSTVQISIAPANCHWGRFRACIDHPQIIVRVGAWLGFISVVLGVVGVILGAFSLRGACA